MYAALIVFASLFPFDGWRVQGVSAWVFLTAQVPPPYWTWFDVQINLAGYAPLGFLLALAWLRSGWPRAAVGLAVLAGAGLSLGMEFLQIYLPRRVPSNMDWLLNSAGTLLGALSAALLERLGWIDHWSRFRARWFVPQARGALVLLALWPWALLFPLAQPFGLGQVLRRLEQALAQLLQDTPFIDWLAQVGAPQRLLSPLGEVWVVALGALLPCLLGYSVMRHVGRRLVFALLALAVGVAVTALSALLSYGPAHAWEWLTPAARVGLALALVLAVLLLGLRRRLVTALLLLALAVQLDLLNATSTTPYFAQTLQAWEQGRFSRFYGLGQWLGWLWPYALLVYALWRLSQRPGVPKIAPHE